MDAVKMKLRKENKKKALKKFREMRAQREEVRELQHELRILELKKKINDLKTGKTDASKDTPPTLGTLSSLNQG